MVVGIGWGGWVGGGVGIISLSMACCDACKIKKRKKAFNFPLHLILDFRQKSKKGKNFLQFKTQVQTNFSFNQKRLDGKIIKPNSGLSIIGII